jgi:four helix bundle protein
LRIDLARLLNACRGCLIACLKIFANVRSDSHVGCSTFVTIWRGLQGPVRKIANQLFAAGSSIGANLEEAKASYSRPELAVKNAISLKESREAKYWLRVATAKSLGKKDLREWLLQESDEFVAMLTVSVRRLQTEADPNSQP